jgi:hypothetical protein
MRGASSRVRASRRISALSQIRAEPKIPSQLLLLPLLHAPSALPLPEEGRGSAEGEQSCVKHAPAAFAHAALPVPAFKLTPFWLPMTSTQGGPVRSGKGPPPRQARNEWKTKE